MMGCIHRNPVVRGLDGWPAHGIQNIESEVREAVGGRVARVLKTLIDPHRWGAPGLDSETWDGQAEP